ncbi:hypothetical protein J5N97_019994 [Dioscorea zingiberensis]|uniref:Uncharacterized protein n=1 Tax=Dioscorea zingiberensis TaxID=325984 RepID=A0A9D5CFM9_9LILI|nr:hypothetical protein J5N97_019994 [Dioscorea zingiberensis]
MLCNIEGNDWLICKGELGFNSSCLSHYTSGSRHQLKIQTSHSPEFQTLAEAPLSSFSKSLRPLLSLLTSIVKCFTSSFRGITADQESSREAYTFISAPTVGVVETLPVSVLRRLRGLPSSKWGSDHLSLYFWLSNNSLWSFPCLWRTSLRLHLSVLGRKKSNIDLHSQRFPDIGP